MHWDFNWDFFAGYLFGGLSGFLGCLWVMKKKKEDKVRNNDC